MEEHQHDHLMDCQRNQIVEDAIDNAIEKNDLKLIMQLVNSLSPSLIQNQIDELEKVVQASMKAMEQQIENLKALVESPREATTSTSNRIEELKIMVQTMTTSMESMVRNMVKDMLKEFEVVHHSNICQNYSLLNIHIGRLEQLIYSQRSKLWQEVPQMIVQFTKGNEARWGLLQLMQWLKSMNVGQH
ncbi:hypothetical protein Sjap_011438 [Stephania japonica]|uniref:Uncharacterized protein n=1 Tax=Stephania japonica TaxID=461633 RepID=A0AAP0JD88_9MAGN